MNQNLIGPLNSPPLNSSSLLNFLVELETDWGFGGTLSSGIDGKLAMRAMCVVCVWEDLP